VSRLQPVECPVDGACPRQGIQQLVEIGIIDHCRPLSGAIFRCESLNPPFSLRN